MNAAKLHTLWRALTRMLQRICAGSASIYAWLKAWIVEWQPREVVRCTGAVLLTRLRERLFWLRLIGPVCMLMTALLRMAEPDTWLGRPFATRFNAVKAGYKTLLQRDPVPGTRYGKLRPLSWQDQGFEEILELALTGETYVTDYIAKEQLGPIETIISDGQLATDRKSTLEHMFRSPLSIRLEDRNGRSVSTYLGYTESELKERFFMPTLRYWTIVFLFVGFGFTVLVLLLPNSRESQPPTREGTL